MVKKYDENISSKPTDFSRGSVNFDYWDGEITVYEGVSSEDDDSSVFMFVKNKDRGYSFSVDSDYEVVMDKKVKDGLAELDTNTYFTIRKKKK